MASDYAVQPVLFMEYDINGVNPYSRYGRYWAASDGTTLPFIIVDSGHQVHNAWYPNLYDIYKDMVDAELARAPEAEITASSQRVGNKLQFSIQVKNLSGVTLSSGNGATVHAVVYEEHTPTPTDDHNTGRIVREAISASISSLANGATETFNLETGELSNVADWDNVHAVAFVDYLPDGAGNAYDMLQAATADSVDLPDLTLIKTDTPDPVTPGSPLTYTIRVVNNSAQDLHATITDTLPVSVTYAGPLVWTPTITTPGGAWEHTFVVTVATGCTVTLINKVEVTTTEGPTAVYYAYTNAYKVYLPLVVRNY
ncbi:MAG TPA: DUF11 domain-containing protein [Thermoflexia bacterium]|nr:DUF11 domain-containing protein [Thermoflexia bacterium]